MAATASVHVRRYRPGDRPEVMALAPRLAVGVAAWRDATAVLAAVEGWVRDSLDASGRPDRAVYVATDESGVVGVVTVAEQAHFTGQVDAYVGRGRDRAGDAADRTRRHQRGRPPPAGTGLKPAFEHATRQIVHPSVDAAVACYADNLGPVTRARELATAQGRWPGLRTELTDLFASQQTDDGRVVFPARYLMVTGQRAGGAGTRRAASSG